MEGRMGYLNISKLHSRLLVFVVSTYFILEYSLILGTPTVKPYNKFDLEKDTETLHKIIYKECGSKALQDTDRMVRMICHRSREQRIEMKELFEKKYNMGIEMYCEEAAPGEISFSNLLDDCFASVLGVYRDHLHRELTSHFKKLDKESIVEMLLSIPPEKRNEFYKSYNETYKNTIQKDADDHLRGDFHNIIMEMTNRARGPDISPDKINWELAKKEAQLLHDGEKKWDNDRCDLDRILMETPIQQLNATFVEFQKIAGKDIEEVLDKHMEKDKRGSYKSMVLFVKNKYDYYARRIQKAMKGWGTQDHILNRIISIRCEEDLKEIAVAFQLNTADSLIHALENETTIHHEMLLTCLTGKHFQKEQF